MTLSSIKSILKNNEMASVIYDADIMDFTLLAHSDGNTAIIIDAEIAVDFNAMTEHQLLYRFYRDTDGILWFLNMGHSLYPSVDWQSVV